jgi:hypothetical protein
VSWASTGRRWAGTRGFGSQKPANLIAGSDRPDEDVAKNRPNPIAGPPSAAAAHHDYIERALDKGLTAQRVWQDLVEQHSYAHGYLSVQRYARRLKGSIRR